MSRSTSPGQPGSPGRRPPTADRRLLLPVGLVVLVAGFYAFQWWQQGASRAEQRQQLLADVRATLDSKSADKDTLGALMTRLMMLEDAATGPQVLAARAEIEVLRGRPEDAYRLFGALGESPSATVAQRRLAARIQLARQDGFNGAASAAVEMLGQVVQFSEEAYADSGAVEDVFRAWQASTRLWDHERAEALAAQLAADHADSREHRLVKIYDRLDPQRDAVAVEDLLIDFGDAVPAELAALRTTMLLYANQVTEAFAQAGKDLNQFAGVGRVRFVLAGVLQALVLSFPAGSSDRADYVERRDRQLDWLLERAPASEPLRQQWSKMRAVR